jgi:hypothetical protein
MKTYRLNAIMAGALYILGTVGGVLSLVIAGDLVTGENVLVAIAAAPSRLTLGTFFILVMGFSLAAMPLFLYPLFRKDSEPLALGMLIFRGPLEGTMYMVAAIAWLVLGALSKELAVAGTQPALLQALAHVVLQVSAKTSNITTFVFIVGATCLYVSFYRTRLIPRWLAAWGLISVVPYVVVDLLKFFGFNPGDIFYMPLAVQEMVMGLWLVIAGFNQNAVRMLDDIPGAPSTPSFGTQSAPSKA